MLSELYQEKLVTEDEVKRMKGERGFLSDRVVLVQFTKPPEVVARSAIVLEKYGHNKTTRLLRVLNELFTRHLITVEECSEVAGKEEWEWEDHLAQVLSTKPAEVVQEACQVLKKHGWPVKEQLKTMNELFTRHLLTAEEFYEVARKRKWEWEDHLAHILSTKPAEVVQEACQVLKKHGCRVDEELSLLSELYQEKLVTEDEVKRMKGERGFLSDRVVLIQCSKPPELVARTANVLDNYGYWAAKLLRALNELFTRHLITAEGFSEVARKGRWLWEDHLAQILLTKPAEVVQEACQMLEKHNWHLKKKLKTLNELFTRHLLAAEECSEVARKGKWDWEWEDHLALVLSTKSAEVVQEACQVLEEHGCRVKEKLKMVSELYQEKLVTEDEVERMKGERGFLSDRVVLVQCSKPPELVARAANVLVKYGHNEEARLLRALNELFTGYLLTAEECSEVARNKWSEWEDHLNQVLLTKPAEEVQEACQVLKKHGWPVKEELKTLNELFTRHLITAEGFSEVAGKGRRSWEDYGNTLGMGMVPSHSSSRSTLRTASESLGYRISRKASSKSYCEYLRTASFQHQHDFSRKPFSDVGYSGSRTESYDSGLGGSRAASKDSVCHGLSTAATSTGSLSHLVESYQKMSMHPLAEGPSQSQTELGSVEVEESKHQESKVHSQSAGEGSGPPREPDSAAVKAAEAALGDLCWIPFGIQSQSVGQEGRKLCLEPSAGAMGGGEGGTILLEVPPGAVIPAESVEVRSTLIPNGPFSLPKGYQLGSTVVYLYYDGHRLTKPFTLLLPHWYGGEDQVRDGLSFAMAPHTLTEGEHVYRFELLEGGKFAEQRRCGVLEISGHCTLFAAVFKVEASSLYYASLWTHQVGGAIIADNEMHSKVVITYADLVWIKVLKKYWKDWKRHPSDQPVQFKFSGRKIHGTLSVQRGEGWEASLKGIGTVHRKLIAYHGIYSHKALKSAVKEHIYPPAIQCVVMYQSPPDCSRGVRMNKLSIEGTKTRRIDFPFKVYEVKTPHHPSSHSASSSSSMGGHTSLLSPVDTDAKATQVSASEFLQKYETEFFEVVDPRLSLLRLVRKGVITEDVKANISTSNTKDACEILYHHLAHHASVDTLKEYCEMATDAEGYPKIQSLGRKMMEELEQGGELTH